MKLILLLLPSLGVVSSLFLCAPWRGANNAYWYLAEEQSDQKCTFPMLEAKFDNQTFKTGWSFLEVKVIEGGVLPFDQAYAMGFLEARLTRNLIVNYRKNMIDGFCEDAEEFCEKLFDFLEDNLVWTRQIAYLQDFNRNYWNHIIMTYQQVRGMIHGYEGVWNLDMTDRQIVSHPIYLMQLFGDLEDLKIKFNYPERKLRRSRSHCSALVKVLPNQEDILFSHVTWNSYASMLRIQKKYSYATDDFAREIAFSGYPGVVTSMDDFVVTSAGLAIMETTIMNHNESLWKTISNETVLTFLRASASHMISTSGKEWAAAFAQYNSGTYNNQWMVLDYKLFHKGKHVQKPGLFTVLEQMPGLIAIDDLTEKLMKRGFWSSYNRAYFPKIFERSEAPKMVKKYGNWYSYDKAPRALIFERDQHTVTDLDSMLRLMRSNNYTQDPFSRCNCNPPYSAESAIAARSDLNDPNGRYPIKDLGFMDQGATDAKITNSAMVKELQFMAIAGPPGGKGLFGNGLPVFDWSQNVLATSVRHHGQPTYWSFDPVIHTWSE